MKNLQLSLLLIAFPLFSFCQHITESFDGLKNISSIAQFEFSNGAQLDTNIYRSERQSIKIHESTSIICTDLFERIGKVELALMSKGNGIWKISTYYTNSTNYQIDSVWMKIDELDASLSPSGFQTNTFSIDKLDRVFFKLHFERIGGPSELYIDDLVVKHMTRSTENQLLQIIKDERLRQERHDDFQALMNNKDFGDAQDLITSYENVYKARIKTLSLLYGKTEAIKLISGTTSSLASYNQLSNPASYEVFTNMEKKLFPNLSTIDTIFFRDEVNSTLNDFFEKIREPVNLAVGIGDLVTGGRVSEVISKVKDMIRTGFNPNNLTNKFKKKNIITNKVTEGITLYNDMKLFFDGIEHQNRIALSLNHQIHAVYQNSESLNTQIEKIFIDYLLATNTNANRSDIVNLVKNQNYNHFDAQISRYFQQLLGDDTDNIDLLHISSTLERLDAFFIRIDSHISSYERWSNEMSSFYKDFNENLSSECPISNVTSADKIRWSQAIGNIQHQLDELDQTFDESYLHVEFK